MPQVDTVRVDYSNVGFIDRIKSFFDVDTPQGFNRTKLYAEQKDREKTRSLFNSVDEYNTSLETMIICETARTEHAGRIAELSERANQFNLSNKRYTKSEIEAFLKDQSFTVLYLSVSDKYGDMGIVSAAVVKQSDEGGERRCEF